MKKNSRRRNHIKEIANQTTEASDDDDSFFKLQSYSKNHSYKTEDGIMMQNKLIVNDREQ